MSDREQQELQDYLQLAQLTTHPDSSRGYLEQALTLAREFNHLPTLLNVLNNLASFERKQGEQTRALRYQLEAITYLEKGEDKQALFNTYFQTGNIYQQENLHAKALDFYRLANQLSEQAQDQFKLNRLLGYTFFKLEEADSALYYYQQCLDHHKVEKNHPATIQTYQDIVAVHSRDTQYSTALEYSFKILALTEQHGAPKQLAIAHNNIGVLYNRLKDYIRAIEYFEETEALCENENSDAIDRSVLYTNLGIAYQNINKSGKAIQYLQKARQALSSRQKEEEAALDILISSIYMNNGDLYNALQFNEEAIEKAKRQQFFEQLSEAYSLGAGIYQELYDYEKALDYYKRHLELRDSFRLEERIRQQELLQQQFLLERTEKEIKLLLVNQEIKDLTIGQLNLEKSKLQLESEKLKLEAKNQEDELRILRQEQEVEKANLRNQALEAERTQQQLQLTAQQLLAEKKDLEISELHRLEQEQQLALANQGLALAKKETAEKENQRQIESLEKEQAINQLAMERQQSFRQFVYWLGGLLFLILAMILSGLIYFRAANRKLAFQNEQIASQKGQIEQERNESERLLLNILPEATAKELKEKGIATPRQYEQVTVLFTDFSGFTKITADMSPAELIAELNTCFRAFDDIVDQYHLEKIKTIGDSYMCAGGIPMPNTSNPTDVAAAALAMSRFMNQRYEEKMEKQLPYWKMRVGIHTGQVIAGVVGKNKFAYDIWGDTVNIASRIESNGQSGKICTSEETYDLIKGQFHCIYRGEFDLKGKGQTNIYFVEEIKPAEA